MEKKILDEIKNHERIIIHRHQNPDGDALGSQLGLAEILKDNFPKKEILVIGEENLGNAFLNSLFENVKFDTAPTKDIYEQSLVIVLDTANMERIQGIQWNWSKITLKIDHHPQVDKYADIEYVDTKAASASEIITSIAVDRKLKISKKAAKYLLTGIITDTGRFIYPSVTSETMKMTSILVEAGASINEISELMNNSTVNLSRLKAEVLKNFTFEKGVAHYMMPKDLHKKYNVDYSDASTMVYLLAGNKDVEMAAFATYDSDSKLWRTSIRSKKIPINGIAAEFNGGGHNLASGAKLKDKKEFAQLVTMLKDELKKHNKPSKKKKNGDESEQE